ncbi:hypothetical protein TVAG_016950 [Trichomonas vaginalis G3]|uniref:Meckelin n=1 Tax=Trichomonas vaginalis (strain ATCC PRA-98 / G3) TaxID=412133 RepID=A2ER33_TRIV3|nr:Meckel-Gruber Syndrome (MKS)-like protein family [Trichomonas vaginalis G3]EAY04923.1 hypothetical protein TVAG_016950 [Trichomonas vaginalis G3]KAI5519419.1 Meckel-Gruber Syndrome (MKS)-like protein family [Trichomonas vaginalis G3]|eukprot:XP_001317146.1 hypothetical protein [Trichomonas vaginalis G3]
MLFSLFLLTSSVENQPLMISNFTCGVNQTYSWFIFDCVDCGTEDNYTYPCVPECESPNELIGTICVNSTEFAELKANVTTNTSKNFRFYNLVNQTENKAFQTSYNNNTYNKLVESITVLNYQSKAPQQREFLANVCAANHFSLKSQACTLATSFADIMTAKQYDYNFWPKNDLFLTYINRDDNEIFKENIILSKFSAGRIINITFARYSFDGEFLGFKVLELDTERCRHKQETENIWRKFGSNYYSSCAINIYEEMNFTSNEFYDPFIQDNMVGSYPVLRPIPVLDMSFADESGNLTNLINNGTSNLYYARRFFLMDNSTTDDIIQYLVNFTLIFTTSSTKADNITTPKIIVRYKQFPRSILEASTPSYEKLKETTSQPAYEFNVVYSKDMKSFWDVAAIVFSMIFILGLFVFAYTAFVSIKKHGNGGFGLYLILTLLGNLLDQIGNIFVVMVYGYSIYYFFFFKLQSDLAVYLPYGEEFRFLIAFISTAFVFKALASIIKLLLVTGHQFFIIDWSQEDKNVDESKVWHRLLVANEFFKISTVRYYNMPFTIMIVVLLQVAIKLELFASPIPDTDLVFTGIYAMILQVGWLAIVFIALFVFELLFCKLYWLIFTSPFKKFTNICLSQNISVLITDSTVHGHYIHGLTKDTEKSMIELQLSASQRLNTKPAEQQNSQTQSFIMIDMKSNCFETYFEPELSRRIFDIYNSVSAQVGGSLFKQAAASLAQVCIGIYSDLNKFLQQFFTPGATNFKLELHYEIPVARRIFGMAPTITDSSILDKTSGEHYRFMLFYGLQVRLYFTYSLLFCIIDMFLKNPVVAGFIVLVVDYLVLKFVRFRCKQNLAKKSLLENRFLY